MPRLDVKFQLTRDYSKERLIRDLIELVREINESLDDKQAQIDALEVRLTNGGL